MWKRFLNSWEIENNLGDFLRKRDRIVVMRLNRAERSPSLLLLGLDFWWV